MDLKPNQATLQMHWRGCTKKWHGKGSNETKKSTTPFFTCLKGEKISLLKWKYGKKYLCVQLLHLFLAEQQHYNRVFAVLT